MLEHLAAIEINPSNKKGNSLWDHILMELGIQLKNARQKAGITQAQAAQQWGVTLRALQQWEQGHRLPRGKTLLRLLDILAKINS